MEYPAELLPQTAYQVIETRELPDSATVLRRIDSDCTDVRLDDFGEVPATVLVGHESLSGRLVVEHKPTVTNFWHCELSFYEDRGNLIRPSKSAWKKKAYEFVLRNLAPMVHLGSDQLSCPPLSPDLYTH